MQAAHTECIYAPSYHQRCWLLNWTLITRWTISLLFSPEDTASVIVFTDSGLLKYSWAHLVISMTESCRWVMQCRLRARRPWVSNKGLRPCPLRTEISPVSLNLLMMLCTVDDEICKAFAILCWVTLFLKYSTIFYTLFHRLESLCPSLLLRDSASLRHPFYS